MLAKAFGNFGIFLVAASILCNVLSADAFSLGSGSNLLSHPLQKSIIKPMVSQRRSLASRPARPEAFLAPFSAAIERGVSGAVRLKEMIQKHSLILQASSQIRRAEQIEERDVVRWLKNSGIDVESWGKGDAKKPSDLLQEVLSGESVLSNGKRIVHVVKVVIRDGDYELVEARQIFTHDKIRTKERNQVLAEKFRPTEEPLMAAMRGIKEELAGVVGDRPKLRLLSNKVECFVEESTSRSFPGLISQYQLYRVQLECSGLTRQRTGMRFLTGEEGWGGKLHVWEWRKAPSCQGERIEVEREQRELAGRAGARYF